MKVTVLLGSPHKRGNSSTIARRIASRVNQTGGTVDYFWLNGLDYKGCQGCNACKRTSEECVVKDDMKWVLEAVADTDVLILATPVYFWDISSQLKGFIDRSFSYLRDDFYNRPDPCRLEPGKTLVWVQTQAGDKTDHRDIPKKYIKIFKFYGFKEAYTIIADNVGGPREIHKRPDALRSADSLADHLFGMPPEEEHDLYEEYE